MALVLKDRVKETTTTTGTGTVTLAGAATGFQSFSAIGDGNATYYTIASQSGSEWEVGIGTYTASGTTLSRTTVLESSNSGSLVNFSAGTKDVFVTYPAENAVFASDNPGTSGQYLMSNGTGVAPTWETLAGMTYPGAGIPLSTGSAWGTSYSTTGSGTVVALATNPTFAGLTNSGNIAFTGTGNRITGDFTTLTNSSRVLFQTSSANTWTYVGAAPSGTGSLAGFRAYASSGVDNSSYGSFTMRTTALEIEADISGTGTYQPINFLTSGAVKATITTNGGISFGSSGTAYGTSGQVLKSNGNAPPTWLTLPTFPSGTIVGTTDTQTLTNKTLTSPVLTTASTSGAFTFGGAIGETVYAVVDAAGVALSPSNGTIQTWTLGASRTPTAGTWNAGESMTLMINDGTAYTVTWTTLAVTWAGGVAPTLATSGYTVVELWKVSTTIYGALVGYVA